MTTTRRHVLTGIVVMISLLIGMNIGYAGEKHEMGGWDVEGRYNRLYKNSERDRVKGVVESFTEFTPFSGMSPGIALIVKESGGDKVTVHLGPKWFVNLDKAGIRKGDKVKIKGVWAEIGDEDVFMAAKIKRSEFVEYKVRRTSDGFPFWAMSEEELLKERNGK